MATWTAQPQECEGTYYFSGQFLITTNVKEQLSMFEIIGIYESVKALVQENDGIDYLLVFTDDQGRKLFFIDQLNKEMIESGQYREEDNHCTLMFADEY